MWWIEITDLKNKKAIYLEMSEEKCKALYQFISANTPDVPFSYGYINNQGGLISMAGGGMERQFRRKYLTNNSKPLKHVENFTFRRE
ncbi:hypothetical protein ACVBB6_001252 [Escherichia coli]